MRTEMWLVASVLALGACASVRSAVPYPGRNEEAVVVDDRGGHGNARSTVVPKGHYPPPGECRIWYYGRPPGHQPPAAKCERLVGRVPYGAFLLYNNKQWDTHYDWRRYESRNPGSVPRIVLRIMDSVVRR